MGSVLFSGLAIVIYDNRALPKSATLLYVVDPMCSWCWGFAPTIAELRRLMPVRIVLGGLAPDSDQPMPDAMKAYIQQAWHAVEAASGAQFNFDFWNKCAPRRSTYPSNRAMILARRAGGKRDGEASSELEWQMLNAIQQAYYLQARNPSDADVLADLAAGLGMDRQQFVNELNDPSVQGELEADFALRRSIGANSFPSIGLSETFGIEHKLQLIHAGWATLEQIRVKLGPWNTNQPSRGE